MVCIMSAMMMMSSVTGTMITPIGAYATPYATTTEVPEDTDGHRNLTSEDTLDVNDGTIHENNGTIVENAAGATVEINNNEIQKNEGTVVENATGATVGAQNIEGAGTVTNNYGTAEKSNVENNYGTAKDSHVNSNWSSGTVTGISSVTHEYGGNVADTVDVTEYNDPNPGPNPPVVKANDGPSDTISDGQPDTTNPEENNDQPQAPAPTNIVGVKGIENAITTQLNNMPADSTNGEIMLEFGTNTNIDADMMYSLLTYTPEGRTSVNEPIFCSFKIDGVTYYLRIDRGTQISAEQIKAFFTNNKSEGPMQIAQWFGNYGVTLVPGADAIKAHMELVTKELEGISESNPNKLINETVIDIFDTGGVVEYAMVIKRKSRFNVKELDTLSGLIGKIQNCTNEADLDEVLKKAQDILDRGKYVEEAINYLNKNIEIFKTCGNTLDDLKINRDEIAKNLIAVEAELQAAKTGSIDTDVDAVKDLEKEFADLQGMLQNIDEKLKDSYVAFKLGMNNLMRTEKAIDRYGGGIDTFTQRLPELYRLEEVLSKAAADRKAILESYNNMKAETADSAENSAAKAQTTAITNANTAIAPVNANAAIAPVNANAAIAPVINAASGTVKGDHSGALGD